jgi:hypothetical protein
VAWFGHVLVPDTYLTLTKAWVSFALEPWDLAASGLDPAQGGPGARPRGLGTLVVILDLTWGSGPCIQGSVTFPWGPYPLLISRGISSFLATWRPWSYPRGGVRYRSPCD